MTQTRREYIKRINIVLDYIEKNLDAELSLEILAKIANYSSYHFHRVFLTVTNERLNEFINRKRIERIASILLVNNEMSLKELAYQYGFNSDSSFSRTFKKYYHISPTQFKIDGKKTLSKIGIESFSPEKYICSIDEIKQWIKVNAQISIEELPELKLATISHIGEFDKASDMFQTLMNWGHQKKVLDTSNFKAITVYHDNPNVTQTEKLRFSAGVTINTDIQTDGDIRQVNLEKGIYVTGHFEIKTEEIATAWNNMCVWIIENNYEFRDGDYFEVYLNDHRTHPENKFLIDICIPLKKTRNIKLGIANKVDVTNKSYNGISPNYHLLIDYMKELRRYFEKEYELQFKLGNIYKGSPDYSYFSLTTEELKKLKLKFVIILDHKNLNFSICLSGQNKSIRKKYWTLFSGSDWKKYHLAESIEKSLSIIDQTIVGNPNFNDTKTLTQEIEKEALKFIDDFRNILE